jgi:phosphate transport system substrate-binding protein
MSKTLRALVALAASAVLVVTSSAAFAETISGGGASFMGTFQQTCAAGYKDHSVSYASSSSGTGRAQFATGAFDFGGSEDPVKPGERQRPAFYHIPVIAGPIVVAYNVKGLSSLRLDNAAVGLIFQGKLDKWNDKRIQALNPGVKLPNKKIVVVYRSSNSGTSGNFTGYLETNKVKGWTRNGVLTSANGVGAPSGSLGFTSNQQVVTALKQTPFTITYADLGDLQAQKVRTFAALKNPAGEFIMPSTATAARFIARNNNVQPSGLVGMQWDRKIKGAYNLVAISYQLVPDRTNYRTLTGNEMSSSKAAAVEDYTKYLLNTCGPKQAAKLGYVPISGKILAKARELAELIS